MPLCYNGQQGVKKGAYWIRPFFNCLDKIAKISQLIQTMSSPKTPTQTQA